MLMQLVGSGGNGISDAGLWCHIWYVPCAESILTASTRGLLGRKLFKKCYFTESIYYDSLI